jgi:8-amino-7-oxononanoate synthase
VPDPFYSTIQHSLLQRRQHQLYRSRRIINSAQGVYLSVNGKECLSFCSNDYLGLANHPEVVRAMQNGAGRYGVGSGAAHLISGHNTEHHALEQELADFVRRPRALLFSTGYMANLGTLNALLGKNDAVFEDRLNHASLIDAGLSSGAMFQRYTHADITSLTSLLQKSSADKKLIVTDGVFSMDGDMAPLAELANCAQEHSAWLMVDDAHGLGVIGEQGRGTLDYFKLSVQQVPVLMGTLGKAFGCFGAFIAGEEDLVEFLIQQARTYIYTTALPPAIASASRASLAILRRDNWRREHLQNLISRFRIGAKQLNLSILDSRTPIQALITGDTNSANRLADALWEKGILVSAIRPPTVPTNSARLRITFSALHKEQDVDRLLSLLETLV